ncbi:hypothetical protein KUV47_09215 [Vannielia litorea]|uniref:hypothetical protein n=1 Tax=Vannielia litorea TaxID=1217970 RepID=UPI001C96CB4F|nr:hypothetical protein [Vannielia litorea]MBY6153388.1 hypothetical protein [Vannielia litorea]
MKNSQDLLDLARAEEAKAQALDAQIGAAALAGDDIGEMVNQKLAAEMKAKQYRQAVESAREVEERERLKASRQMQHRAVDDADQAAVKLLKACEGVDAQMLMLGEAYEAFQLAAIDAGRAFARAGASDGGRLATGIKPALRWALANFAETFAQDSGVPRVPANRRRSLHDSVLNLVPHLEYPEEAS